MEMSVYPLFSITDFEKKHTNVSSAAKKKLKDLKEIADYYRPVKSDVNHFLRAFIYSYLEQLIIEKEGSKSLIKK